ncbi:hypothetical protein Tco_0405892, partial [Tanacetum coccineum]
PEKAVDPRLVYDASYNDYLLFLRSHVDVRILQESHEKSQKQTQDGKSTRNRGQRRTHVL